MIRGKEITAGWSKLFELYYQIKVSDIFLSCLNQQIFSIFKNEYGVDFLEEGLNLVLSADKNDFYFDNTGESFFTVILQFKYSSIPLKISWTSKSRKIYNTNDEFIDCNDIEFKLTGLSKELFQKHRMPEFSLFPFFTRQTLIDRFVSKFNITISNDFLECADKQLTRKFEKMTNSKFGIKLQSSVPDVPASEVFLTGPISKIKIGLCIGHNTNDFFTICWKSKSCKIYSVTEEKINCDDLFFWLEDVNIFKIHSLRRNKVQLPFSTSGLKFEVESSIQSNKLQMMLEFENPEAEQSIAECQKKIDDWLFHFNDSNNSNEERLEKYGVVEQWLPEKENGALIYSFDFGSGTFEYLKELLSFLSSLNRFKKLTIH